MPVIDASVLVEYLASGEHSEIARERIQQPEDPLWAPHLVDAEVGHALRREVRLGRLDAVTAGIRLGLIGHLPLGRVPHKRLLPLAWELGDSLSFYDALYVSLAEALEEPLVTFDARLARAKGNSVEIELLGQAA
jgi:predicted nucleic acid-binding protein